MPSSETAFDVAIIGGGPGGSTTGTLLKKYAPEMRVLIVEKERFPRDHVGESQLPMIGRVLDEMGVWNKIEAANFPIKLGATYTWGKTTEPWVFSFVPLDEIKDDQPRPGLYEGWRKRTAFQVDRSIYDDILLRHAAEQGCEVREGCAVTSVERDGDHIVGLKLSDGTTAIARHYVDASGNAAVLRRAMDVGVQAPTQLRNIAFWGCWNKPGLNSRLFERKTIRVLIRSLPYGWLWFIALSDDRSSVGLVCPADYYKQTQKRPEELYHQAVQEEKDIAALLHDAKLCNRVQATTDWSFVADRAYGENWFLCGESLGFADPILAAGLTLTHTCARHLAYTLLALDKGLHDSNWLKEEYQDTQTRRVRQHMKFADYWYSGNGCFSAIQENCARIAKEAGLTLDPTEAFRWLSTGGIDDDPGQFAIGGHDLASFKQVQQRLSHKPGRESVRYLIDGKNVFKLNLTGAHKEYAARLVDGKIEQVQLYVRAERRLAATGAYGLVLDALKKSADAERFVEFIRQEITRTGVTPDQHLFVYNHVIQALERMVNDYWVHASIRKGRPSLSVSSPEEGEFIFTESRGPASTQHRPA